MQRHHDSPWYHFWLKLKEGYDSFEATGKPPIVKVCSKQYMVNVSFGGQEPGPSDPCPAYAKLDPASIQTIDGVPPSVVASLSGKGEAISRPAAPQQPVMAASFQTAPSIAHRGRAPGGYVRFAGHFPPRAEAGRNRYCANAKGACGTGLYRCRTRTRLCPGTANGPGSGKHGTAGELSGPAVAPAYTAPAPTYTASAVHVDQPDPNSLQKLNRSGKGGKLPGADAAALSMDDQR